MSDQKTVLITGATGQQGGAVARQLLTQGGFKIRAMTRKPDGNAARALAAAGAEVVTGDLGDAASLDRALAGAWGVWAVMTPFEAGLEAEEAQGKRLAERARETGVRHYVYSSVGSADRKTGVPHFESKFRIEEKVRQLAFPSHVILRPVYFMENLLSPWSLSGDTLASGTKPTTKLQMIAVEDVGKFGALAFTKAAELNRAEIDIAGDEVTMLEAVAALSEAKKMPIKYVQLPMDAVRKNSEDLALMLEWFEKVGYDADINDLKQKYGIKPLTLREWAAKSVRA